MTSRQVDTYTVEPRAVLGKVVHRLRRDGVLPANIYGRGIPSLAVQVPARTVRQLLLSHGTNTLIQVQVSGESAPRPVMVRAVRRHPATSAIQHLDFYQVDLLRAVQVEVPVVVTGVAPAVQVHGGVLLHGLDMVHVEALPADVPEHLVVSVAGLAEIDAQVTVADLVVPARVRVLTDPAQMVARIGRPRVEEVAVVPGAEAAAAAEGAAVAAAAEESAD